MTKIKRKRKPMTPEQRQAAAERLAKAREAKGPVQNLSMHESLRDLDDDHPLSPKNVKTWIKSCKQHLSAIKSYRLSKEPEERRQYYTAENYIKNMQAYLSTGIWIDGYWGENREKKMNLICIAPAYKDGEIQRNKGTYYRDIGTVWGEDDDR